MTELASALREGKVEPGRPVQTHLARALLPLVRAKSTGALGFVDLGSEGEGSVGRQTQLVLVEGQLVFAESEGDAARCLQQLVERGALGAPQAVRLERRVLEEPGWSALVRASELAVTEGRVPPIEAHGAIAEVVRTRVAALMRTAHGEWRYHDDPRAVHVPRYRVPFERTVIDALCDPACAPRFAAALTRYAQHYPKLEGDGSENTTLFGMTPARFRTLRLLDGTRLLSDVLAASPLGVTEAAALIAGLTIFERLWWNTTPMAKTPTGERLVAKPRPASGTVSRVGQGRPTTPSARPLSSPPPAATPPVGVTPPPSLRAPTAPAHRGPTPSPLGRGGLTPPTGVVANDELVRELLRRRSGARAVSQVVAPGSRDESLSARAWFERGRAHHAAGRLAPAAHDLARAHELEPDDASYKLHARFAAYLQSTDAVERELLANDVLQLAHAATKVQGGDAFAFHVLGRLAFDAGDDDRARRAFAAAERLAPDDVETLRYQRLLAGRVKQRR